MLMYLISSHSLLDTCLPVDACRPLFEKGRMQDIQMLSGSDPSQGLALSARFSTVLNLSMRIFCISCLPFATLIYCPDLCQSPGLRARKWACFMNDHQFIPRPRQQFGFIGGDQIEGWDANWEDILECHSYVYLAQNTRIFLSFAFSAWNLGSIPAPDYCLLTKWQLTYPLNTEKLYRRESRL